MLGSDELGNLVTGIHDNSVMQNKQAPASADKGQQTSCLLQRQLLCPAVEIGYAQVKCTQIVIFKHMIVLTAVHA
ncbi:hypothetical protein D3C81_2284020 [compost metagenome]